MSFILDLQVYDDRWTDESPKGPEIQLSPGRTLARSPSKIKVTAGGRGGGSGRLLQSEEHVPQGSHSHLENLENWEKFFQSGKS